MRRYVLKPSRISVDLRRYEQELNPQQFEAVTAGEGPHLVIAGAGSGKTRVVTYRVAYLLDRGIEPSSILLTTFTNKAAREMLRRAQSLVNKDIRPLWGGTFHHLGNLTLRRHSQAVGLSENYTILDREDAKELLESCASDLKPRKGKSRFPKGDVLQDLLSFGVNTQTSLEKVLEDRSPFFLEFAEEITRIANRYEARKRQENLVDYDDLLLLWWKLLNDEPMILEPYATRFRYLLCDEYQDTNRLQGEILDLLASHHRNLMVVGDDAQSIYRFRGAHYENILRFTERYPDAMIHKLELNYRSTPEILGLANASICWNRHQYRKTLKAIRPSGPLPVLVTVMDELEQAAFVAQRVLELQDEGIPLHEIAALYRSHYQSLELQLELTRRGIPFEVRSGLRFFEQAHVKDVTSFLRIVSNPWDELSWRRALKLYPGVGSATAERIWQEIRQAPLPLDAVFEVEAASLLRPAQRGFGEFLRLLKKLKAPGLRHSPAGMIQTVLEEGYEDYLKSRYANWFPRLEDLHQLATFAGRYQSLEGFLSELALLGIVAGEEALAEEAGEDRLVLSTIHQAKGLEWTVVFLIWLAEGKMPAPAALKEEGGEEEERRLFYVAATRAKEQLYLSYPLLSQDFRRQPILVQPSRFVKELPEACYEMWEVTPTVGNDG
ncbi:MAG: ATP-dependent helicase [candidate division NC10 bacterium]|nr:ATP-dependent helicase [candidate division NC10 bacterium]